jgi:hypothetical protein
VFGFNVVQIMSFCLVPNPYQLQWPACFGLMILKIWMD